MFLISGFFPPAFSSGRPRGRRHAASGTTSLANPRVTRPRTDGSSQTNRCFIADLPGKSSTETFQTNRMLAIGGERGKRFLFYIAESHQCARRMVTQLPLAESFGTILVSAG